MQRRAAVAAGFVALSLACSEMPVDIPQSSVTSAPGEPVYGLTALSNSHGHGLTAIVGEGDGIVNVSPEASQEGFSVETQVSVWKTSANASFHVKRAVDFDVDGVCTNSDFIPLPVPNPGPLVTLITSPGGAGSVHVKFNLPSLPDGSTLDVHFEVSTPDGSIVLRTDCFTVAVK